MAEMVCSALVQEVVSRSVSSVFSRDEEKASQRYLVERLEMAVRELEFALERAQDLPIRHLSLLGRRKQIKSACVEAMELLDKQKQQAVPARQELQVAQGVKRKRWVICVNNMSVKPSTTLSTYDVRRFEWYAECAGRFVRDVESCCSLHHYTFCNPIIRHLLGGKTLEYNFEQGNLLREFLIWPTYSDERGVEAMLACHYYDRTMADKSFTLLLTLRLSESTDIVGVAIKGLQLLASEFKPAAGFAMGELTLLSNLQDIACSYGPPWVCLPDWHIENTQFFRPDPACCKGSRYRLCAKNNASSELSDIFPEQILFCWFLCYYYVPEVELTEVKLSGSSCSSQDVVGRSKSRGDGKPPLVLSACFSPHKATKTKDSCAVEIMGGAKEYRYASIQQVTEALNKSDAINCFFRQPELTEYRIHWYPKHGRAWFKVEKASTERVGAPRNKRYNTRGRLCLL